MIDAGPLQLPDRILAILWDMDGVLIDSLKLDEQICEPLLREATGEPIELSRDLLASGFHLAVEDYLPYLAEACGIILTEEQVQALVTAYDMRRAREIYALKPNIVNVLTAARDAGLAQAVVSNNTTPIIHDTLTRCGLRDFFQKIVGNDIEGLAKKPAPDPYIHAAKLLEVTPSECAVIEDSLPGTAAGRAAGAYVVGVATGAATLEMLAQADTVDAAYKSFACEPTAY